MRGVEAFGKEAEIRRKWGRQGGRGGLRDALIGCYRVYRLMYRVEIAVAGEVEKRRGEKRARFDFVVNSETFLALLLSSQPQVSSYDADYIV